MKFFFPFRHGSDQGNTPAWRFAQGNPTATRAGPKTFRRPVSYCSSPWRMPGGSSCRRPKRSSGGWPTWTGPPEAALSCCRGSCLPIGRRPHPHGPSRIAIPSPHEGPGRVATPLGRARALEGGVSPACPAGGSPAGRSRPSFRHATSAEQVRRPDCVPCPLCRACG